MEMEKFHFARSLSWLRKKIGEKGMVVDVGSFGFSYHDAKIEKLLTKKSPGNHPGA